MMKPKRSAAAALAGLLVIAASTTALRAQDFPDRQVTIVSPYQAGGTSDIIARLLAKKLGETWRQPVVVDNRPGANGGIGVNAVVRAPADGHTLLAIASSALVLNPLLYRNLGYETLRDLAPITRTGFVPNVIVVNPAVPAADLKALIALAKARPGTLNFASQGIGSNGHLTGLMFAQRAGVDIVHIPYKGSMPAVTDLVGGQVQLMFDNLPTVLEQVRAGQLRALAVTTTRRTPLLPDVPTVDEAALPGFDSSAWFAVLVAKGTPERLRAAIEQAVVGALNDPEVRQKLAAAGISVTGEGSAELARRIEVETAAWKDVIGKAGLKID
ncbi:tripartite tricarboxylate transporter substrate binding protein [Bradyrhizobium prioriisuperbiae]|uniref:Bug family tripartite tricarboxylate transporter substrate binding protein n=1 Tax=Bradyrhizobium prioriisuperbiae TaxID=2854389 RepID=UPI0028EC8979|nr:tripartite tricarboxylate transporter substrate binding protein [Bradyrhizobium prioritasuperba]